MSPEELDRYLRRRNGQEDITSAQAVVALIIVAFYYLFKLGFIALIVFVIIKVLQMMGVIQ